MIDPSSPPGPSVEFRRIPLLGAGPGVIKRPLAGHLIVVYVDERQFDPALTSSMDELGTSALNLLQPVEETRPVPALRVRVRRSGELGRELAVAEITPQEIIIGVDKTLMSEDLATFLSDAGTMVTRDFIRRTP
ncbi:hypothetical protein ACFQSB_33435 [Sphaerisporangium rhizosphaerae]|uniref:Uncharacterized protein n=2 Tax=Sphaerisporangium rhizosphaerae TaxID=2269375 RepID=A0ABW2PCL1_9ACTN